MEIRRIPAGQHVLFLDDEMVEERSNTARGIEQPIKHPDNPLLVPEYPWEGSQILLYGSVLRDPADRRFRMWYFTASGDTDNHALCYAESEDGLHWTKPRMDIIRCGDERTNLLIRRGDWKDRSFYFEPFGVIEDPGDPDPARRFKVFYISIEFSSPVAANPKIWGSRRGMGMAVSADGLHWTPVHDWLTEEIIDISCVMFDPLRQQYVLYGRDHRILPEIREAWGSKPWFADNYWGRCVVRQASADTLRWSRAGLVMASDPQDPPGSEVYTMSVFPYEGLYVGMIQRYINNPEDPERDGTLDYQYAVSRDGITFEKVGDRTSCLPLGKAGEWDRFNQSIAHAPVVAGDEVRFYYSGRTSRHTPARERTKDTGPGWGAIGLAMTGRDRFACLSAGFDAGVVLTRPFLLKSPDIFLNLSAAGGAVTVQVTDAEARPLEGLSAEVGGNHLTARVPLDAERLARRIGTPVRLRFFLKNARLYSFWKASREPDITSWPTVPLPVRTGPGIDRDLRLREDSRNGRTVLCVQNPSEWDIRVRVRLSGLQGQPVVSVETGEEFCAGAGAEAGLDLDIPGFGTRSLATPAVTAGVERAEIVSADPSANRVLQDRLNAVKTAIQKASTLSPSARTLLQQYLCRMQEEMDRGRVLAADRVWSEPGFRTLRDIDLRMERVMP